MHSSTSQTNWSMSLRWRSSPLSVNQMAPFLGCPTLLTG